MGKKSRKVNKNSSHDQPEDHGTFPFQACVDVAKSRGFKRFDKFYLPFAKGTLNFLKAYSLLQKRLDADSTLMLYSTDPATIHFFSHPSTTPEKYADCVDIAKGIMKVNPYYVNVYKTPNMANTSCPSRITHPDPPSVLDGMLKNLGKHDEECVICYEKADERAMCMQCTAAMCMACYRKNNSNSGRCPQCRVQDDNHKNRRRTFVIIHIPTGEIVDVYQSSDDASS